MMASGKRRQKSGGRKRRFGHTGRSPKNKNDGRRVWCGSFVLRRMEGDTGNADVNDAPLHEALRDRREEEEAGNGE